MTFTAETKIFRTQSKHYSKVDVLYEGGPIMTILLQSYRPRGHARLHFRNSRRANRVNYQLNPTQQSILSTSQTFAISDFVHRCRPLAISCRLILADSFASQHQLLPHGILFHFSSSISPATFQWRHSWEAAGKDHRKRSRKIRKRETRARGRSESNGPIDRGAAGRD